MKIKEMITNFKKLPIVKQILLINIIRNKREQSGEYKYKG